MVTMNRSSLMGAVLVCALAFGAAGAPARAQPVEPTDKQSGIIETLSIDAKIGEIAATPAGKEVLERNVPGLIGHPLFEEVQGLRLKDLLPFTQGRLTSTMLEKVSADLAALPQHSGLVGPIDGTRHLTSEMCSALAGMTVPAAQIGLPTTGARVTKVVMTGKIPAGIFGPELPPLCLATGLIAPVDKASWNIEFKVALPIAWNGRALLMGGGGFDGFIPDVTGRPATTDNAISPLARGYAVFASDGGHKTPGMPLALDGSFALNREALENWLGDALKKTRDVSIMIIERAYGRRPDKSYVSGGSGGGRETLQAISRWPKDWDGAVAIYPARNSMQLSLQALFVTQQLAAPGSYPSPEQRGALHDAALERCDQLDGLKDGVIANVRGCLAVFDPAKATLRGAPLRCPNGTDIGKACLSDLQLSVLRKINEPHPLPYAFATGEKLLPGLNVYTADIGRPITSMTQAMVTNFGLGTKQPAIPLAPGMSFIPIVATQFIRYLVTQDPSFNPLTFDINHPGPFAKRIMEISKLDSSNIDLSAFARRGGKLIMLQGTDDMQVSPRATSAYYSMLQRRLGRKMADQSIRLYEVPGYAHTTSTVFNATWDPWSALEAWAERGVDPAENLVITDVTGVPGRTRPLCKYPRWPKYERGEVNEAASFVCVSK